MAITDSIVRLGTSLIATLHTRLELASVEIEEEFGRYASYFLLSLFALFCGIVSILLIILLVLILFWDSHRELALFGLIALFAIATLSIVLYLKSEFKNKPRLFAASLNELENDLQTLRQSSANARQDSAQSPAKSNKSAEDSEGF